MSPKFGFLYFHFIGSTLAVYRLEEAIVICEKTKANWKKKAENKANTKAKGKFKYC